MKIFTAAASSALLLAACGGDSGDSVGGVGQANFSTMESRGTALIERIDGQSVTPIESMPTTGTATYSGIAGFASIDYDYEVISEASLTANFGASTIAGSLTNFRDFEDTALPGTVTIQSGVISGNQFEADLTGSVTVDGVAAPVDGIVDGGFVGADGSLIAGIILGTFGGERFIGGLAAERR